MNAYRQRLGAIILFLSDIVIVFLLLLGALSFRDLLPHMITLFPEFMSGFNNHWWFIPIWMGILAYEGAYTRKFTFWDEIKLLWKVSLVASLVILIILFLSKASAEVSRTVIVLMGLFALVLFPLLRISVKRLLINSGMLKSRVLILGTGALGNRAREALQREPNLGYEVVGFLDENPGTNVRSTNGVKIYRRLQQIERYIRSGDIQDIVIAVPGLDKDKLSRMINKLQHKVRHILYIPDVSGMAVIGTELRHFFHDQFLAVEIKNNLARPFNYVTKKIFDYLNGIVFFLLLIIPLLFIALIIRITSRGSAIFKQERIGKHGKPFMCYKFRTMYNDAEKRLNTILENDPEARKEWDTYWKLENDPRVTPIGKFLRKTSLDELPQLFNVLGGQMSLVGPRPVTQEEIKRYYKDAAELCFSVLPGITGLWQVSGRSNASYDYRVSLDSWYVRNWNLWLDIVILLKTVNVVIRKEGAR